MKKLLMLLIVLLAMRMAGRAAARDARVTAILWLLIASTAQLNNANTPKARSTEARLNDLVTQVYPNTGGDLSGPINCTSTATSEFAGAIHSSGVGEFDGGITTSSVTSTGSSTSEFSGGIHSAGTIEADGEITATLVNSTGTGTSEFSGGIHSAGTGEFDTALYVSGQRIAPGQGTPSQFPIATSTPWEPQVVTAINAIVNGLKAAGIFD